MLRLEVKEMRALSRRGRTTPLPQESPPMQEAAAQGCFLVAEGLDPRLVQSVHLALEKLFDLSAEVKRQYRVDKTVNPLGAGYSPYGVSKALDTGLPNLLETWDVGTTLGNWPGDMEAEWRLLKRYERALYDLAAETLAFLEILVSAPAAAITSLVSPANGGIHLIHYFPLTPEHLDGRRRQSEHCDNTLITLIPPALPSDSEISVFNRTSNSWEHVHIGQNECLVQIGLLLERITGDYLRANLHTVRNPDILSDRNVDRISTPFFLSPGPEIKLRLLPSCSTPEKQAKYPDIPVRALQHSYFTRVFS